MPTFHACPSCETPVRDGACTCPFCGASACRSHTSGVATALLGVVLTGCVSYEPAYGVPYVDTGADADGDGWTVEGGDCDDTDDTVHPDATETPGDGIDSNCDDEDDT